MNAEIAEAIAIERVAVLAHAEEHARQVTALVARGQLTADEATVLNHRVRAFAEGIATGLHVGGDAPDTRRVVRAAVQARREQGAAA